MSIPLCRPAAGFKRAVRDKIDLTAGATLRLDVTLEVGSVGEMVEVAAQASPLEAETTRVATTINTRLVQDLPLFVNGSIRSVLTLALIAPEAEFGRASGAVTFETKSGTNQQPEGRMLITKNG